MVIILTLYDYPEYRDRAKIAEASGFVNKADLGVKLMPLISELFSEISANKLRRFYEQKTEALIKEQRYHHQPFEGH